MLKLVKILSYTAYCTCHTQGATLSSAEDRARLPFPAKPIWGCLDIGSDIMQRISLAWFSNLGVALAPISDLSKIAEMSTLHLYRAREQLNPLSDPKIYPLDLRASRPVMHLLLSKINAILNEPDTQKHQAALDAARWDIWLVASGLETLLMGELAVQPVYHVWPKRAYNIEVLVSEGENIFSVEVKADLNDDERYNIREAGKCLAFEIPTAAAFHIFRCAKSVLRRYYEVIVAEKYQNLK